MNVNDPTVPPDASLSVTSNVDGVPPPIKLPKPAQSLIGLMKSNPDEYRGVLAWTSRSSVPVIPISSPGNFWLKSLFGTPSLGRTPRYNALAAVVNVIVPAV